MNNLPLFFLISFSVFNNLGAIANFDWERYYYEIVSYHNVLREKHGVPPLTTDPKLEKYAEETVIDSLYIGTFKRGESYRDGEYLGQNLYLGIGNPYTGRYLTNYWYSENAYYNYYSGSSKNGDIVNHFTQMIWKTTQKIGCAYTVGRWKTYDECYYICCYYSPGGNLPGLYVKNVPRPKN